MVVEATDPACWVPECSAFAVFARRLSFGLIATRTPAFVIVRSIFLSRSQFKWRISDDASAGLPSHTHSHHTRTFWEFFVRLDYEFAHSMRSFLFIFRFVSNFFFVLLLILLRLMHCVCVLTLVISVYYFFSPPPPPPPPQSPNYQITRVRRWSCKGQREDESYSCVCARCVRAPTKSSPSTTSLSSSNGCLICCCQGIFMFFFFFYVCGVRKTTARAPYTCEANAKVLLWKEEKKREENNMIRMAYTSIILKMHNSCMRCVNFLLHLAFHSHVFVRLWHWNRPKSTVCVCNAISRERTNYFPYFT